MSVSDNIAIAYDFNGTLAKGNLPEHGLLQDIGIPKDEFWKLVKDTTRQQDADEVLVYMHLLLNKAKEHGISITREMLNSYSKNIPYFNGVVDWFNRINSFAEKTNIKLHHFVISSGLEEIIETSIIARYFDFILASKYLYDSVGIAQANGVGINYTTKTQYLFRINKGIMNYYDNKSINEWVKMDKRPFPFSKIIYIGDGDTDIPAMKMTRSMGGYSIAVFDPKKWNDKSQQDRIYKLVAEDRTQYVAPADYSDGSQLDIIVKGIIGRIENAIT